MTRQPVNVRAIFSWRSIVVLWLYLVMIRCIKTELAVSKIWLRLFVDILRVYMGGRNLGYGHKLHWLFSIVRQPTPSPLFLGRSDTISHHDSSNYRSLLALYRYSTRLTCFDWQRSKHRKVSFHASFKDGLKHIFDISVFLYHCYVLFSES